MLQDIINNIGRERFKKIVMISIMGVLVLATVFSFLGKENIDVPPNEPSASDLKSQAWITNSDGVIEQLGSVSAYESLTKDLFVFAKFAYLEYKNNPEKVVGFKISDKPSKKDSVVELRGKYGSVNNSIKISITLLSNQRISTSITDEKTDLNIDQQLPSNSAYNKFIASLPKDYGDFSVDFDNVSNKVTITPHVRDEVSLEQALQILNQDLPGVSIKNEDVRFFLPPEISD